MTESTSYSAEYGFDRAKMVRWLALFNLAANDHLLAKRLQREVIIPKVRPIIDAFYAFLLEQPEFNRIISQGFELARLKHTQADYLLSLGVKFDRPAYFEKRLHIGMTHARVGVPLGLYQAAYCKLRQSILDHFPPAMRTEPVAYQEMSAFVLKITALDMALAIETYHLVEVHDLHTSLDSLRDEASHLHRQVETDPVTGLKSREYALAVLRDAMAAARRDNSPLHLVMADLDLFKKVNDTYGHVVGDDVLRGVASRMQAAVREFDVVGRYGGEEFIIILANTSLSLAESIAERMRKRVMESPLNINSLEIRITISIGMASFSADRDIEAFIGRADAALYQAKKAGRNRIVVDGIKKKVSSDTDSAA